LRQSPAVFSEFYPLKSLFLHILEQGFQDRPQQIRSLWREMSVILVKGNAMVLNPAKPAGTHDGPGIDNMSSSAFRYGENSVNPRLLFLVNLHEHSRFRGIFPLSRNLRKPQWNVGSIFRLLPNDPDVDTLRAQDIDRLDQFVTEHDPHLFSR
jgi:hypothetical protein